MKKPSGTWKAISRGGIRPEANSAGAELTLPQGVSTVKRVNESFRDGAFLMPSQGSFDPSISLWIVTK
jgi:hypothetical protein